jgi:hypothetical protein
MRRTPAWVLVVAVLACLALLTPLAAPAAGAASISGHAWAPDGTTPAGGIAVQLWWNSGGWAKYGTARMTGSDGAYSFTGLPNGMLFAVEFRDPAGDYIPEFWNDKGSLGAANTIILGATEARTGIDATLAYASSISGVVRDSAGLPISGITVNAYTHRGGTSYDTTTTATTTSLADGTYTLGGLPAGSYGLQFFSGFYASHYRSADETSGVTDISRATPIALLSQQDLSGVDETMLRWGSLAGSVDSATGLLSNVTIDSYRREGATWIRQLPAMTQTDAGGIYTAAPLYPGRYRVKFTAPALYPAQYHRSALDPEFATEVTVTEGAATPLDTWLVASDTQAPVSGVTGIPSGWGSSITPSITSTDEPGGSGVAAILCWYGTDAPSRYTAPASVTQEGSRTLSYMAVDGFGNRETTRTVAVRLDTTPPTPSSDATTAPYANTAVVNLHADDGLSGVSEIAYKIGSAGAETSGSVVSLGLGVHEVYFGARDLAGNWSGFVGPVTVTVVSPPAAPGNLSAAPISPGPGVSLSWIDNSADEAGFVVERSKDSTADVAFSRVETLGADAISYSDTSGLDRTSTWYYRVRAFNVAGTSSYAYSAGITLAVPTTVYRFYNFRQGVHFYTASETEKLSVQNTLGGIYTFEGPAYTLNSASDYATQDLYRFYNFKKGVHFYTASDSEMLNVRNTLYGTYRFEGVAYKVSLDSRAGAPVWRFYNPGQGVHFYTASEAEKKNVVDTLGGTYRLEGVAFYLPR